MKAYRSLQVARMQETPDDAKKWWQIPICVTGSLSNTASFAGTVPSLSGRSLQRADDQRRARSRGSRVLGHGFAEVHAAGEGGKARFVHHRAMGPQIKPALSRCEYRPKGARPPDDWGTAAFALELRAALERYVRSSSPSALAGPREAVSPEFVNHS
jgi:hypothetical protein